MDLVVTYDVKTGNRAGERRLRRVATTCQSFGQRVQYSVFEVHVDELQLERFRQRLLAIINVKEDSLRIYRLHGSREDAVETYGVDRYVDMQGPLVL